MCIPLRWEIPLGHCSWTLWSSKLDSCSNFEKIEEVWHEHHFLTNFYRCAVESMLKVMHKNLEKDPTGTPLASDTMPFRISSPKGAYRRHMASSRTRSHPACRMFSLLPSGGQHRAIAVCASSSWVTICYLLFNDGSHPL